MKRTCLKGQCNMERVNSHKLLAPFLIGVLTLLSQVPYAVSHFSKPISAHLVLDRLRVSNLRVQWAGHSTRTSLWRCFINYYDGLIQKEGHRIHRKFLSSHESS